MRGPGGIGPYCFNEACVSNTVPSATARETEQRRLGGFFSHGGFPRVAPHDESAACREAWLQGYDEAQELVSNVPPT